MNVHHRIDVDEVKRRVGIVEEIAKVVKLERRGHEFVGVCPFHAEKTGSFTVVPPGPKTGNGFFHCFGCGAHGDVVGFVMRNKNLNFLDAVEKLGGSEVLSDQRATEADRERYRQEVKALEEKRRKDAEDMRERAWRRWEESRPLPSSPAEAYLRNRGITIPLPARILRFHPALWNDELQGKHPAMVAAFQYASGNFRALHRTWLQCDSAGKWTKLAKVKDPKKALGGMAGAAIRLTELPATGLVILHLQEGIETSFSVKQALMATGRLGGRAVWAAGTLGNMAGLVLPAGRVSRVVLGMDADMKRETGEAMIARACEHYHKQSIPVDAAWADDGTDFNDMATGKPGKSAK